MAAEDIGGIWNVKQPGYDDTADIQAALKLFLYGSYTFDTSQSSSAQKAAVLAGNGVAKHLQQLSDRVTAQETLGIGSDFLTLSEIQAVSSPTDGYIAIASDSSGLAVQTTYGVAIYQNDAPSQNLTNGVLWVDKDSPNRDIYVYDDGGFRKIGTYTQAKGDLLVGSAQGSTDILSAGDNGKVLTVDSTSPLGITWASQDYEINKNTARVIYGTPVEGPYGINPPVDPSVMTNGVDENDTLKTILGSSIQAQVVKTTSSTTTRITFSGLLRPTTDTSVPAFVGLQRKINTGSYETVQIGLVPKELVTSNFVWIDAHGATTGDTITYRILNITPVGYSANTITQQFGLTSDTFIVEEI
ncbi:hypothetical protein EB001_17005 [bacterium]|nr:hypothetical protein [bacterium]